ncbi:hypothetical protein [Fibrisoma limi]|nr:hypothetical protein [Fibrisoma limi]
MRKRTSTNYRNEQLIADCPTLSTFYFLSGRWKVAILWNLVKGPVHFHEF